MSAAAFERQIRPIYGYYIFSHTAHLTNLPHFLDALDTGSNKATIVACNKLLKKHPKSDLLKVLICPVLL